MKNIAIIVQARTGSSRMPNKMLESFYNDTPLLEVILERIKIESINLPIIVATTDSQRDDVIEKIAIKLGIDYYRGSENDVLARFIGAAERFGVQKIIRLCADNPLIDTSAINILAQTLLDSNGLDYLAYSTSEGVPTIKTHYGFWAEGTTINTLKKIEKLTDDKLYHEHVTNYIYANPKEFSIKLLPIDKTIDSNNKIRLTIDTKQDFENIKILYSELMLGKTSYTALEIVEYIEKNPRFYDAMIDEIKKNIK